MLWQMFSTVAFVCLLSYIFVIHVILSIVPYCGILWRFERNHVNHKWVRIGANKGSSAKLLVDSGGSIHVK
jgi:hypothetical protein